MQLEQFNLTPEQAAKAAPLVAKFLRSVERQQQTDAETVASMVRVMSNPRGVARGDADRFNNIVRAIVREELKRAP